MYTLALILFEHRLISRRPPGCYFRSDDEDDASDHAQAWLATFLIGILSIDISGICFEFAPMDALVP